MDVKAHQKGLHILWGGLQGHDRFRKRIAIIIELQLQCFDNSKKRFTNVG